MTGDMLKRRLDSDVAETSIVLKQDIMINVSSKVAYISPYDEEEYLIGLEFESFHKNDGDILESYINENAGRTLKPIG